MEHYCKAMTLGDHSIEKCTICGADLNKSSYNELLEAIERVRELHKPHMTNFSGIERIECSGCFTFESDDFGDEWTNYKPYPCETIKAIDGE
jgi:hypothetical protein